MKAVSGEAPPTAVRRAAMNLLARREQSFQELLDKLTEKFPDYSRSEIILPALERLRDEGLQSDSRFVEAFVRYRSSRGVGPLKIAAELYPKKIDESLQRSALYDSGIDWTALCSAALRRKFRENAGNSAADRQRQMRFLQQRGFDGTQIRQALRGLAEEE